MIESVKDILDGLLKNNRIAKGKDMDILQFYESNAEKKIYCDKDDSALSWISMAHYHRAVELCIPVKNSVVCCINGEKFEVEEGNIVYIDSFDVHYFGIEKGSMRYAVVIGADFLEDFYNAYGKRNSRVRFPQKMFDKEKNKKIFRIVKEWGDQFGQCNDLQNLGYVNLLFGTIADCYEPEFGDNDSDNLAVKILSYINENFCEKIDLDRLAQEFSYSKSTISRVISSTIGEDLRTYVNLLRARNVHKLLKANPKMSVAEAAEKSGFNSLKTFYRAYAQVFGENPKMKNEQ